MILLLCLAMLGCSNNANQEPEPEPEPEVVEPTLYTRPICVAINNYPGAIKVQTGLDKAYMIYEVPVEYGLSRLLAFYRDDYPEVVGTIRSARHYFFDYFLEHDAIFVHYGMSQYAEDRFSETGVDHINGNYEADSEPFYRDNPLGLDFEHTAYLDFPKLLDFIKNEKQFRTTTSRTSPLPIAEQVVDLSTREDAIPLEELTMTYCPSIVTHYEYSPEDSVYYRFVNGREHTDFNTKEQYSAKNIVLVELKDYDVMPDGTNIDLHTLAFWKGWYITNGYAVPIYWEKYEAGMQTIFKYASDSTPLEVNEGNVWVQIYLQKNQPEMKPVQPTEEKTETKTAEESTVENSETIQDAE